MARIKLTLIAIALLISTHSGVYFYAYNAGWNSHQDAVDKAEREQRAAAEIKQAKSTQQTNEVKIVTETKYKTIYRDVVKYVDNPSRMRCDFDNDYIGLRQSALDADVAVSRNAGHGVRIVERSAEKH